MVVEGSGVDGYSLGQLSLSSGKYSWKVSPSSLVLGRSPSFVFMFSLSPAFSQFQFGIMEGEGLGNLVMHIILGGQWCPTRALLSKDCRLERPNLVSVRLMYKANRSITIVQIYAGKYHEFVAVCIVKKCAAPVTMPMATNS